MHWSSLHVSSFCSASAATSCGDAGSPKFSSSSETVRRAIAESIMTRLGCTFDPNQVGMFLWGKIPEKYDDVEQLTERVLHEARVFITPGFIFGSNGNRFIRISLCAKDDKMREALKRIEALEW